VKQVTIFHSTRCMSTQPVLTNLHSEPHSARANDLMARRCRRPLSACSVRQRFVPALLCIEPALQCLSVLTRWYARWCASIKRLTSLGIEQRGHYWPAM
jgi:hypothetical protein